ncbi:hypothetical protein F2Q68_00009966 [Brassica cretica]|uniref:Bifunctional inhibitor/plant lipid transfer protein/seed storage helical domain-containing protein n=1 Tax=Brassica cretica TaxID=69181 RepID=A0A8S9KU04_BRACR|nr:hypothetical protein F2Q68_00009966 [Brassica cretica]
MAPRTSLALFLFLNLLFFTYTSAQGTCPRNALQIGACTNVLNAIDLTLGNPPPLFFKVSARHGPSLELVMDRFLRSAWAMELGTCPRNALQIGACTNVLNAIDLTLGNPPPPVPPCCSLIAGLADLEAAVCLCTALDVNVLGINVHLPIDISVLFNACCRFAPPSFQCP